MVGSSWACATKAQNSNATDKALRLINYRLSGENFSPRGRCRYKRRTRREVTPYYIYVMELFGTAIIGCLARDGDVVWVTLQHARVGDAGELGIVKGNNIIGSAVAHTRT